MRRLRSTLLLCIVPTVATAQLPPGVWTLASKPAAGTDLNAVHFRDGLNGLVAGANASTGVLYRTTDGGTTWVRVALPGSPGALNDLFFLPNPVPTQAKGFVVGDANYVAITNDGGATWTQSTSIASAWPTASDLQSVYFASSTRGFVVGRVSGSGSGPRMAATVDSGVTWRAVPFTGAANNLYDIDFFDMLHGLVVGTGNPTRKSSSANGGFTWEADANMGAALQTESVSMYGLDAIDGSAVGYAVGGKNYASPAYPVVRRTTDYGATWSNVLTASTLTMQRPAFDVVALGPSVLYVSGQDGAIIRTIDGGATWTAESLPAGVGTADLHKFSMTPDNYLWVVGTSGNVLRTRLVPNVTFAPADTLDFGALCVGDSVTERAVEVGNDQLGALLVTGTSIVQPSGGKVEFEIALPTVARVWPQSVDSLKIVVRVRPGARGGVHVGELRITTNDENGTGSDQFRTIYLRLTVPTSGIGIDSAVSRDAGQVRLGARRTMTLTRLLRNTSTLCPATIDSMYLASGRDFRLLTRLRDDTLAVGDRRTISIEFAPTVTCALFDTLVVTQSDYADSFRIALTGTGVVASYETDPADTLRFGAVQLGTTGSATLRLINKLADVCLDRTALRSLVIAGPNAAEFATSVTFRPGVSFIPPDDTVDVPFTATPAGIGPRVAWAIITHELSAVPDTIVLLARGVDAELASSIDVIDFGVSEIGRRVDSTLATALRNTGATAVTITDASIVGADAAAFFLVRPTAPRTVGGRASDTLVVGFLPSRTGTFTASIVLQTDIGTTIAIALIGEGDVAAGELLDNPIVLAPTMLGRCRVATIERFVRNTGRVPLRIGALNVVANPRGTSSDVARFTVVAPSLPPELVIAPGDSLPITLRFCPDHLGEHVASLELGTNIPGSPLLDTIVAVGIEPRVTSIDTIDFGTIRFGSQRDSTLDPFFVNFDASTLAISSISLFAGDVADFALESPTAPLTIEADSAMPALMRFRPTSRGVKTALLRIESGLGSFDVVLTGRAIYPVITVDGPLAPKVRVGRAQPLRYWIHNRGDDTGRIDLVAVGGSPAYTLAPVATPILLAPSDSIVADLVFTPPTPCEHRLLLQVVGEGVRHGMLAADSSIAIDGVGVVPELSARDSIIIIDMTAVGATRDTLVDDFVVNRDPVDPSIACIDSVAIDATAITGADASSFSVVAPIGPSMLQAGDALPLALRFTPNRTGTHRAMLEISFDGSVDSVLSIELLAEAVDLPEVVVGVSFGADQETQPGATIRVPMVVAPATTSATVDSLVVDVAFERSLLRLERVVAVGASSASAAPPDLLQPTARSLVTIARDGGITSGVAAELEFTVLLGSRLSGDVYAASTSTPGRQGVLVVADSANVSIEEFCDAQGRRVTFGGELLVRVFPNPVGDELMVEYDVPSRGPASLTLHDASGATVVAIVDGILEPGRYTMTLDARSISVGTYYCVLRSGHFESTAIIRVTK